MAAEERCLYVGQREVGVAGPEDSLELLNIQRHHAGSYICTADNGVGPTVEEEISVEVLCEEYLQLSIMSVAIIGRRYRPNHRPSISYLQKDYMIKPAIM